MLLILKAKRNLYKTSIELDKPENVKAGIVQGKISKHM